MKNLKYFFLKIIILQGICSFAQSSDVYTWFDQQVGYESSGLFNGIEFINRYNPIDDKHRFFETSSFTTGDVFYDNQTYYNVELKFDTFENQLIVKIDTKKGTNQILLLNDKIESFRIGKSYFEKIKEEQTENIISSGFYQVLVNKSHIKLYKQNHKKISKGIKNNAVYYEFKEVKPIYIAKTNEEYFVIKRKRDLTKRYPDYKKELSNYRWTSRNYNKNDTQIMAAINRLNQILEK